MVYDLFLLSLEGKRGREAEGQTPVIIACENKHKKAGFIAMKAFKNLNFKTVKEFVSHHLLADQHVRMDAYPALNGEESNLMLFLTPIFR
jgi:hypothetical protein